MPISPRKSTGRELLGDNEVECPIPGGRSVPAQAPQGCVGGTRTRAALGCWLGCRDEATHVVPCSFPAKKYKKVTGKEIYSDTLESTPMLEKEKFPQDYFPEVGHGRRPLAHRAVPCQGAHGRSEVQDVNSYIHVGATSGCHARVLFPRGSKTCVRSS